MRKSTKILSALSVALTFSGSAGASDYQFDLYNETSGWTLSSFKTNEAGKWGQEWLHAPLKAGQIYHMDWGTNEGPCKVGVKLGWVGYQDTSFEKTPIDFCKIKEIHLNDNGYTVR